MAGGAVFDIELLDQPYCEGGSGAASGRGETVNGRSLRISDDDKEYSHIQEVKYFQSNFRILDFDLKQL